MKFTMASLFDGAGGFPLAASMCGGSPVWASEVEPYPIAVTRSRFPGMKHLGDISKINGAEIDPVDVITFGSPCQDLSVAGKRAGLKHEDNGDDETTRSGLFMEAVRIIKEMREATNGKYPRYAIWENVPGAFSSNSGNDFRVVLEELIKIAEPSAVMSPVPAKGWAYADSYAGDGWSLAYRVPDAQYWGVPQRRRRIYLVADFRGQCAGEILFERDGLRGYFAEGRTPWQGTTTDAENSTGTADSEGKCVIAVATLATNNDQYLFQPVAYSFDSLASNSMKSKNPHSGCRAVEIAKTLDTTDPNPSKSQGGIAIVQAFDDYNFEPTGEKTCTLRAGAIGGACGVSVCCFEPGIAKRDGSENRFSENVCSTLRANMGDNQPAVAYVYDARGNGDEKIVSTITGDHNNRVTDYTSVVCEPIPIADQATRHSGKRGDKADGKGNGLGVGEAGVPMNTLTGGDRHAVAYAMQGFGDYKESEIGGGLKARDYKDATDLVVSYGVDCRNATEYPEITGAVQASAAHNLNSNAVVRTQNIVRRLTPTECARLQGFPDWWGHPDMKTEFSEEEHSFWMNVRNTHAEINGKTVKYYTPMQMLTWYSRLHNDSSEYKMWGNGIALPCALYVMQGISEALDGE